MISDSDLTTLRSTVGGPVSTAGDPDYADDASGYNLAVVHEPDVIVGATSAADVAAAIGWAAEHGLPVAVKATGHGATERMTDGVLINTRRMQDVQVDPERRVARVAAGVKWKTLLAQTCRTAWSGSAARAPTSASSDSPSAAGCRSSAGRLASPRTASLHRGRDAGRADSHGRRRTRAGPVRGASWRQGQLRHRHRSRVRARSRLRVLRRRPDLPRRRRRDRADRLPRLGGRPARGGLPLHRAAATARRAVRARAAPRSVRGAPALRLPGSKEEGDRLLAPMREVSR